MRKPIIAGNWKLNKTISETTKLIEELVPLIESFEGEAVAIPTAICLSEAKKCAGKSNLKIGAQNMYYEGKGAFTGETSVEALVELGIEYVVLGHSERRQYFHETDSDVNKKVVLALQKGIKPILCIGETLEQREGKLAKKTVLRQVTEGLRNVNENDGENLIVAYEPIWAIGTGRTATKDDANSMCAFIRQEIAGLVGKDFADRVRILYGGSVKSSNIKELMGMSDIDGALVGGASLEAVEFSRIVNYNR